MADSDDIAEIEDVASEPLFGEAADDTFSTGEGVSEDDLDALFEQQESVPAAFGKTWEFDFETGQFVREGGRIAKLDGRPTFAQWCMNVLHTERLTAAVYSDQIGVEFEKVARSGNGADLASLEIQSIVEEALGVHDRFDSITRFETTVESGTVYVDMTIKTSEGEVDVAGRINR